NTSIDIIKDNAIKRGGCTINTGLSTVDASIDSQLEKIKQVLME
ncbi:MAG TPA: flagellar assembly protein FliH, partial [Clostridiaceae bacterium]|nr:flagellar assembly protein FliH [Clostridiaceae bacterium]